MRTYIPNGHFANIVSTIEVGSKIFADRVPPQALVDHRKDQDIYLQPDPLVDELQRLAPEISVHGGSFAHWLRPPAEVLPQKRGKLLERVRREATEKCLMNLLSSAGLPYSKLGRLASGARDWPTGHSGSVSHKGTKVVAALVPIDRVASVGIDIETRDGAEELLGISGLAGVDELPPGSEGEGSVVMFSVKEAIFKALHPVLGHPLGFDDVAVSWTEISPSELRGNAYNAGITLDVRCSAAIPAWVVSVALALP